MATFVGLTVESFHKLDEALSQMQDVGPYVTAWMDENGSEVITGYLTEHGVEVGYSVTDGDLSITLS